ELKTIPEKFQLESMHISSGTNVVPTATVGLKVNGTLLQEAACGEGPVDATFKAIDKITGLPVALRNYTLNAVSGGKDAMGEVTVHVEYEGRGFLGRGLSTDIIEASAKAYINALNKLAFEYGDAVLAGKCTREIQQGGSD
ncbi:MAG: 2-isopropylmalate synthase, partial [Clostridia bacterium]|nr:2-isopropylmalate synthase [Clostridia bacterium]